MSLKSYFLNCQLDSDGGKYAETGFRWLLKFKDSFSVLSRKTEIYLKYFFFEENDPRVIEVQSFKKNTVLKVVK